jgi:hypothetical protein
VRCYEKEVNAIVGRFFNDTSLRRLIDAGCSHGSTVSIGGWVGASTSERRPNARSSRARRNGGADTVLTADAALPLQVAPPSDTRDVV